MLSHNFYRFVVDVRVQANVKHLECQCMSVFLVVVQVALEVRLRKGVSLQARVNSLLFTLYNDFVT